MNEDSFPPRDHYLGRYNPLLWTSFGGPGGAYLRHFTGLSVVWGRGVHRIDFAHDVAVPFEQRTLGCLESGPWTKNIDFAVDGPGGEIIEAVEVFRYNADAVWSKREMVREDPYWARYNDFVNQRTSAAFVRPPWHHNIGRHLGGGWGRISVHESTALRGYPPIYWQLRSKEWATRIKASDRVSLV